MLRPAVALLALAAALACSEQPGAGPPTSAAATEAAPAHEAESPEPARRPGERPLPAFEGVGLDGQRFSASSLLGKRLVLFFFNPDVADAAPVADAVAAVARSRSEHNFRVVGVAEGGARSRSRAFVAERGLDFPVLDDSDARIANRLGLRAPVALLGVDAEGYVTFGLGRFPKGEPEATRALVEARLRESLRIPAETRASGELLDRPEAPLFTGQRMQGGTLDLSSLRGRPVVLIFFLSTCPHCHHALEFLKEELPKLPEASRPTLVGVEVSGRASGVAENLEQRGLAFFDVVLDRSGEIRDAYGIFGGVPVIVLLDAQGRIVHRNPSGWYEQRDPALLRMRLAKLAGAPVPMLLDPKGYTGSDVCGVCHQLEYATWEFTQHAGAYDTLVRHGQDRDAECVSCHVVGFGEPGGFVIERPLPYLEDVGCESCHGRGGPHLSPGFAKGGDYAETCLGCHDSKHSLGFEYASFRPRISHATIAALPATERAALLADGRRPREVLPARASFVGSEACRSCHAAEFETWSASPHARAVESIEQKGRAGDADCLRCHTTGYAKPGGFPEGAPPGDHADLARVGCEACHGPGGDHVAEDAPKRGSILGLADKCDSCVILQICGDCHDEQNDPGFEFEVVDKIEQQRHGTIPPKSGSAASLGPREAIAHGFALPGEAP